MKKRKSRKITPDLDFAPMVALTLVLLSYFILTTTRFRDSEKEIKTPWVSSEPNPLRYHDWAISIFIFDEIGDLHMEFHGYRSEAVIHDLLKRKIFSEKGMESFLGRERILIAKAADCKNGFQNVANIISLLERHDTLVRYCIKADEDIPFFMIGKLMEVCQSQDINRFGLWARYND